MTSTMEWIRRNYGVPARHRMRVTYDGRPATILGTRGPYLRLRVEGERRTLLNHPTYLIVYPQITPPPRPRGWCSWCSRDRAMTKDGNVGRHAATWNTSLNCPGTGKPPMWPVQYRTNAEPDARTGSHPDAA